MIQMRPSGGGLPYAPNRDLVNSFPQIARRALYCLTDEYLESWFKDYLKNNNIGNEDLCAAAVATAQYINQCRQPELGDPVEVLNSSGFAGLTPPVQLAILAKIGQVTMAMYYATSRDALRVDEKPMGLDSLLAEAERLQSALGTCHKDHSTKD